MKGGMPMKDEWSGLANLLADLILKYADKVLADDSTSCDTANITGNSNNYIDKNNAA